MFTDIVNYITAVTVIVFSILYASWMFYDPGKGKIKLPPAKYWALLPVILAFCVLWVPVAIKGEYPQWMAPATALFLFIALIVSSIRVCESGERKKKLPSTISAAWVCFCLCLLLWWVILTIFKEVPAFFRQIWS